MKPHGMMYHIVGLCPRTDISLGRCGFGIHLYLGWKEAVEASGLTQDKINTAIKNCHRAWLDGCGYSQKFDPDRSALDEWEARNLGKEITYGPNAHFLYDAHSIRVQWGPWGPEHISVPGNACGLDIDEYAGMPIKGMALVPHNIDSLVQVVLLLTVFTTIADYVINA